MSNFQLNLNLQSTNRAQMRTDLIRQFTQEQAGTGTDALATRYRYDVEKLANTNYGIYLKRPTRLNKGFDFTVNVEGLYFKNKRKYSNPSHDDIINALSSCKTNFSNIYQSQIKQYIKDIYNCNPVNFESLSGATFPEYNLNQHPIEIILLAIKWLFMEQDCAYWNYSGRAMLFEKLQNNGLI